MRFLIPVAALVLSFVVASFPQQSDRDFKLDCSQGATVLRPLDKTIVLSDKYPQFGRWVTAEGSWKVTTSSAMFTQLPKINSVSIDCYDRTMVCTERLALVHTKQDLVFREDAGPAPLHRDNLLDVVVSEYRIVEWTPTLIRAQESLPVADVEIQISVTRQTATRLYREKASASDRPVASSYALF